MGYVVAVLLLWPFFCLRPKETFLQGEVVEGRSPFLPLLFCSYFVSCWVDLVFVFVQTIHL